SADRWRGGNWTGLAYTARHSGRIVRSLFADIGYGPTQIYVTNAVKCFPADPDDPSTNREPTTEERTTCGDHLATELTQVDPTVVVTTGRRATAALLDREGRELDGFIDHLLEPIPCPSLGVTVLPILHPSYQSVWLARLDLSKEAYIEEIGRTIASML
ncbi:MAG: uracil-DNA glycosylase family protein, partial [Halobacteriales archaeon]|nr:uracil-DNA glycosylase family protein [Halobacteriales archaeon]